MRDQMKTALGPEEVDHLRNQFEPFVVRQLIQRARALYRWYSRPATRHLK